MNGAAKDWFDAFYQSFFIGVAALFWIAIAKIAMVRFPIPGARDVVGLV